MNDILSHNEKMKETPNDGEYEFAALKSQYYHENGPILFQNIQTTDELF